jgi:ketosteroid isomerase-like protein
MTEAPGMTETDAVLAANLEFYRAFSGGDYPAMNALWAREAPVMCIHPGWAPLSGREQVMRAWRNILTNPEPTRVACHDDQAFLYDTFAVVICEEELPQGHLVASNSFVKEADRWRMVHHQASPLVGRPQGARPQRRRGERR